MILVLAVGWRTRRWRLLWVPASARRGRRGGGAYAWLFGGDADPWAAFDPETVMTAHGPYSGVAGWFAVSGDIPTAHGNGAVGVGDPGPRPYPQDTPTVANYLCAVASRQGIECSVVGVPTKHDWTFGAQVFADSLPWLAGRLRTPGVPQIPLPGVPSAPPG